MLYSRHGVRKKNDFLFDFCSRTDKLHKHYANGLVQVTYAWRLLDESERWAMNGRGDRRP